MNKPLMALAGLAAVLIAGTTPAQQGDDTLPQLSINAFGKDSNGENPRLIVQVDSDLSAEVLDALGQHAKIHGWLDRYRMVALTPHGRKGRAALESLSWVTGLETDHRRYLTEAASWDRDILDVHDVGPAAIPPGPDAREVAQTGAGVTVAVIDTGLIKRWRDVLDTNKVRTDLARAFMGGGQVAEDFVPVNEFHTSNPTNLWERDTNSHGTSVASHVIGYDLPGLSHFGGVAPDAQVIPLKVFPNGEAFTFDSRIIAAIAYVTRLKADGVIGPTVINMSLGGSVPGTLSRAAINDAIAAGVIVVASAGNSGEAGMGWPGAYPEVISAGATALRAEFGPPFGGAFWFLADVPNDPDSSGVPEQDQSAVAFFSSRARPDLNDPFPGVPDQELDVMAPGQFTVAPCLFQGAGGGNLTFCFWSGTSFASPLTAGVAALLLEKDGSLSQTAVETALTSTAGGMPNTGGYASPIFGPVTWDPDCGGVLCDPVGTGLVQADAALASIP